LTTVARRRPDDAALRALYRGHVDAVYAFFAYAVERHTAEDLTGTTFERAIKAWGRFDPAKAGERTWLLAIARNLLTDHYRRQRHRDALSLDAHADALELPAPGDDLARRLDQDELRRWLAHLSERERSVLALRYGADLEATEVAELLELSAANVHQIVSRATRKLRAVAEEQGGRVSDSA